MSSRRKETMSIDILFISKAIMSFIVTQTALHKKRNSSFNSEGHFFRGFASRTMILVFERLECLNRKY